MNIHHSSVYNCSNTIGPPGEIFIMFCLPTSDVMSHSVFITLDITYVLSSLFSIKCYVPLAFISIDLIVSEHMSWVRNVVLMSVYFGFGKPQGVGISGRGPDGQVREIPGSVYEQPTL